MTQEETQFYTNLKDNPSVNNYVFNQLFTIINGTTIAKPNVVLQLIGGIPMVTNCFTDNDVFNKLFPGKLSNQNFQDNQSSSFQELSNVNSNQYALNNPFGKNSLFYKSIYTSKNIDFVKITEFLKLKSDFNYNYDKFIGTETFIFVTINPVFLSIPIKYDTENPLIINSFSGEKKLELKGKLYDEAGTVNTNSDFDGDTTGGYELKFNYKQKEIEYLVHYYFDGKKRVYEKDNIDNIAFTVSSSSFDDFNAFLRESSRQPKNEYLEKICNAFTTAINEVSKQQDMISVQKNYDDRLTLNTQKLDSLNWLYENIPFFVAQKLDFDQTIQNVFKLSHYDKGSIFKDTTKSITSILSKFDPKKVYSYFLSNPQKLIDLLAGFSDDTLVQNFCNFLTGLTFLYLKPEKDEIRKFNQGDDTHIETNILFGDQKGKVELTNELQLPSIAFNTASLINFFTQDIEINNSNNRSNQFHPLELIYLTHYDEDLKEEIAIPTIALYAKYLGDQSEWSDVLQASLAVFDIISIIVSGGALTAGLKGTAKLFAIIDIAVSSVNLALLSPDVKNVLNKTEGGRWFVNHWGIISFCLSAGTISYYLAKGIIKYHKQVQQQLKNEPKLTKQIDELVEESKKVVGDNIIGEGRYGGKILSKVELDDWAKLLKKQFGTNLEKVSSFDNPNILAQFDANTNTILYKDEVTQYFIVHESLHAEEMKLIGFDKYVKDAPLKGVKEVKYTKENLIRRYNREKYVFESLIKKSKQFELNNEEIWHSKAYFYEIEMSLIENNIKIPK
ncbi:zincin-like metallopeptidase toxin domain-containing protein [Flavobacterium sp. SUN052]|uniref:zincin-like metallopeptidase toxin domain-containing protein n=1 Tax=Flavobacterium sp. SUN052 TaxID=3002441 RepID=UPI00237ECEFA|nr:zincin-like metallopeptidase toxin domain-containing protein [Flavobacterium sp. SUN052]MEC4004904.1 zincin-like metallopeptidase toxin domain-containing protein [Flavobacterium sp. SUN052]